MEEEPTKKMLRLRSSDGQDFEVPEDAITAASGSIKAMLEDGRAAAADVIPLPNVTAPILSRVLRYVNKQFDGGIAEQSFYVPIGGDDPPARFDDEFLRVDNDTLIDLIQAADNLNIVSLLDLACKAVAEQMKGKTVEEIRKHFHIVNDYTEEELEEVRRENSWAFEQ